MAEIELPLSFVYTQTQTGTHVCTSIIYSNVTRSLEDRAFFSFLFVLVLMMHYVNKVNEVFTIITMSETLISFTQS